MFAKRHLEPFATHMTAAGERMLADWDSSRRDGDCVDVADAMMRLTLDVAGRALFGTDLTGRASDTIVLIYMTHRDPDVCRTPSASTRPGSCPTRRAAAPGTPTSPSQRAAASAWATRSR